ncbi:DUF3243 domain-containing protein [Bacillus massiliigorillae]|uniref:DUF3243 domain-containing protein n=1 Tax=Bacillus massiliigorillae TaxID=1243664 RepID=UPI0003A1A338|nr:DUF3243 domain-containing protein [Bacillus massiliigorillae]
MSILDNWDQWKNFLGDRLSTAQSEGLSSGVISELAFEIGDYLANNITPKNDQEKILAEIWSVASEEEKHAIANVMVKMVNNNSSK